MKFILLVAVLVARSLTVSAVAETLGCRDEAGNLVDWFYLYKLPSDRSSDSQSSSSSSSSSSSTDQSSAEAEAERVRGLQYYYATPTSSGRWTLSDRLINQTDSFTGRTLDFIYGGRRGGRGGNSNNLVLMYSDQPPMGAMNGERGHTKGVVVANEINGFWLIHSVPKFPPTLEEGRYGYPDTGTVYGQSFLCISLNANQLFEVGKQLQYNEPNFYSTQIPDYLRT